MPRGRPWTIDDLVMLRNRWADTPTADLAEEMGRTAMTLYVQASKMGLRKSAAVMKANGAKAYAARRVPNGGKPGAHEAAAKRRATSPEHHAHRKRLYRQARDALVAEGLDEGAAGIAVAVIARGKVPAVRFEY